MDLKEKRWKGAGWIHMSQVRTEGRTFGKTVTVQLVP